MYFKKITGFVKEQLTIIVRIKPKDGNSSGAFYKLYLLITTVLEVYLQRSKMNDWPELDDKDH